MPPFAILAPMIRMTLFCLVLAGGAFSQVNNESSAKVRKLIGDKDGSHGDSILSISADQQGWVAAMKAEEKGSWSLHVFRTGLLGPKEAWSERYTDQIDKWCPAPSVYLTKSELRATMWERSSSTLICNRWKRRVYVREGDRFLLKEIKEEAALCELGCYTRVAAQVLTENIGKEQILAIVLSVPSFARERAYVLARDSNGPYVIRREFTRQLWSELGIMRSRKSTDEALALARGIPFTSSHVVASGENIQALVDELNLLTPRKLDSCPRGKGGSCVLMEDGRSFDVWLGSEPPFKISDTPEPEYRSENPVALRWVYEVMAAAGDK